MARETRAAALTRVQDEIQEEEAGRELYVLLSSATNPDTTPYRLPVEIGYMADSLVASGVATAPGAGAAIATLAAPPAGKYRVRSYAGAGGAAVGEQNNFRLRRAGVDLIAVLPHGMNGDFGDVTELERVDLNGSQNLTIEAIAAGTAAIEYGAVILATRIE